MKVLALNGSARKDGNTALCIAMVCDELRKAGIETETLQLGGKSLRGCLHCDGCLKRKNLRCVIEDEMNIFIEKSYEADGIIIGSPTYMSNVTTEVKAYIDRCGYVNRANDGKILKGKVGVPVVVMARSGGTFTYSAINYFYGISEMIVPMSNYWNLAIGHEPGEVLDDEMGIQTFHELGKNMSLLLKSLPKE